MLLTGCCGRIGAAAAKELLQSFRSVRGFDLAKDAPLMTHPGFEFVQGRIQDIVGSVLQGCSVVVHLAGCPDDADWDNVLLPSNIQGTVALLQAIEAHNVAAAGEDYPRIRRLIVASSGKLFAGYRSTYPIEADTRPAPVCAYGATKAFVEAAAEAFSCDIVSGCPVTCLRFGWCPRTPEDVEAMRRSVEDDGMPDEFLSPRDAATCIRAAAAAALHRGADAMAPRFAALFVQSIPRALSLGSGEGEATGRFDLSRTRLMLPDWEGPVSTFPDGIDAIVAARAESCAGTDIDNLLRPRDDASPGIFLQRRPDTNVVASPLKDSSVRMRVTPEEWDLRVTLAAAYRIFAMHGWTHSIHVRLDI